MICAICDKLIDDKDRKRLYTQGKWYTVHKGCLRKTTQQKLIEKGLIKIKIDGHSWQNDVRE